MNPEISIIMSEYNTEESILKKSIQSILNQTYKNFEFIIINDGSSSKIFEIISEFNDPRIKLINNTRNLGLAGSLNKAIQESKGSYLVRMDTDDYSHPQRISIQYNFIKNNPQYSVVGTSVNLLADGRRIPKIFEGEIGKNELMNRVSPVHPSVIMKKKDIISVGMYDESMRRSQDFALWAELLLNNKRIYVMPDILLDYRVDLKDYQKRKLKYREYEIRSRLKYYKKLGASPVQYASIIKSIISGLLPKRIMYYYHNNLHRNIDKFQSQKPK